MPPPPSSPFPGGSGPASGRTGNPLVTPPTSFIGRYQVLEKIGEGGMGSLYLARDPAIDRLVAIKLLRRGFDTEALRERFAREARAAGRLRHPNIVTIFDVGEHDGDPFIAMEFLPGETLAELVRHGAGLSLARRLKLLEELCDGLAYAHRAGLVHRDIKPANLMVDAEGVLKILDFGIVRVGDSGITQAGVMVGTINYMSPEQVLGTGVDHRSDIFAVGLVAYELLSGRQAFAGTLKDGLLRRIPNAEIEPLSGVVTGLDPEVVTIVEHALQKEPGDRYQELVRMRNDLTRVRQRIEAEEERAAIEAASASAETAFIAHEVTAIGVPTPPPPASGVNMLADAERALAEGNYRYALTVAGRAAAVNPLDHNPSSIVARAEAALLERGRTRETNPPATPRSGENIAASVPSPPAASSPGGTTVQQGANYLTMAVAVIALIVAGFAVWSRVGPPEPLGDAAPGSAIQQPPAGGQETPVTKSASAAPPVTEPPPVVPPPPESQAETGSQKQMLERPGPAARGAAGGRESRTGTRGGTTETGKARNPGRPQPPRPEPQAGTPERTDSPVPQVPVSGTVSPPATLPGTLGPRPTAPPLPPKSPEKPQPRPVAEQKAETPPARDPKVEARAAIEQVLRRYEAAWEALDFNALTRVWAMTDPKAVQAAMAGMREYSMEVKIQQVEVAPDGQSGTAVAVVSYRYRPAIGSSQRQTQTRRYTFTRRGDTWMITGLT